MRLKEPRTLLFIALVLVVIVFIAGSLIGLSAMKLYGDTQAKSITPIAFYELVITQVITQQTLTAVPTETSLPQPSPTPTSLPSPTPGFTPAAIPLPSATSTQTAIFLEAFSWNVYPGDQAFIKVRVEPGWLCSIEYFDPLGVKSSNQALASQLANEYGICFWSWEIDEKSPVGIGLVDIQVNHLETKFYLQITAKE